MINTMYSINLQMVCNMKTLTNAFGFVVIVFTTQIWEVQVASHTKQMLIIRKGKSFVSKMVEKNICETAITITNITVAKRKKRLWLFVIFKILKCKITLNFNGNATNYTNFHQFRANLCN